MSIKGERRRVRILIKAIKVLKNLSLNVTGRSKQYPEGLLKKKGKEKGVLQLRPQ